MPISTYPDCQPIDLAMRPVLHPLFQQLPDGISEFTFANLYLFRATHQYQIARLTDELFLFCGQDAGHPFFMLPFGLPEPTLLKELFNRFHSLNCVAERQISSLQHIGCAVIEDRDNFDYLYARQDLSELPGKKFHKKRNLIKAFLNSYAYEGKPLLEEYLGDALMILDAWRHGRPESDDYAAAKEALQRAEELQLCGGLYYVDGRPVAYSLGEELARGTSFVIHFEKAVSDYKGLWQFVNQAFASILPEHYDTINREQDLGDAGLRQAKLSYNPVGFVKKYRAALESDQQS